MRSFSLTSAAMLIALLAAAPASAEEEAATVPTEAMDETQPATAAHPMDPGMAEAAAEQEAMEADLAAETEMPLNVDAPISETPAVAETSEPAMAEAPEPTMAEASEPTMAEASEPAMAEESEPAMESDTMTREVITGTVVETTGPAALPPENINVPVRGMHMDQVEKTYGKPIGINPPVGDPPITRWDYPGYSVYFEYSYVIQSVGN